MSGLPHFRSSKASVNNWEPLYLNLFDASLVFPAAVGTGEFVMENLLKVDGLDTDKVPGAVTQIFKGAQRSYAAGIVEETFVDITLDFEVNLNDANSAYVYKALKKWCNLIYDPSTGAMSLKKDYVGGPLIISVHNKAGEVYRQWKFPRIFPITNISAMSLDYSSGTEIFKIEGFTLRADFWDEASV